jgi:hypothetical protein
VKRERLEKITPETPVAAIQVRDFLARHSGLGTEDLREGKSEGGRRGWWEMTAADGYKLRCDWLRIENEEQLNFSEIAPGSDRKGGMGGQ